MLEKLWLILILILIVIFVTVIVVHFSSNLNRNREHNPYKSCYHLFVPFVAGETHFNPAIVHKWINNCKWFIYHGASLASHQDHNRDQNFD